MTQDQKKRWILLQAFAEADEEYGQLMRRTADVDDLLMDLRRELTKEQLDKVEKITGTYLKLANCTAEMACKYMVFPRELK